MWRRRSGSHFTSTARKRARSSELQARADAEITQHVHHGAKFESIAQRTLCNPQRSGSVAAVSEHDNLVRLDLNSQ